MIYYGVLVLEEGTEEFYASKEARDARYEELIKIHQFNHVRKHRAIFEPKQKDLKSVK